MCNIRLTLRWRNNSRASKSVCLRAQLSLRDDHYVAKRIAYVNASMGAMSAFWDDNHVDVYSKYLIFRAIPCNLLLWGCEIWALRQTLLDDLEVFLHQSVRRILQIKMRHVIEHRIKNEQVR